MSCFRLFSIKFEKTKIQIFNFELGRRVKKINWHKSSKLHSIGHLEICGFGGTLRSSYKKHARGEQPLDLLGFMLHLP